MKTLTKIAILFVLLAALSFGQTALTSTTLSAAVTATQNTFTVASATGITGMGTANQVNTMLYVDRELVRVRSVSSTTITVDRNPSGSPGSLQSAHVSGALVWIGTPAAFQRGGAIPEGGQCVRTALAFVPIITVIDGVMYDCLGVTTAGQYVVVNQFGRPKVGSVVASVAGVINPTGTTFHVSGALAITGITVPAGFAPGMSIFIVPDGTFTWTAATNISLAGTAVVNKTIVFTWDGTKWNPSVIA